MGVYIICDDLESFYLIFNFKENPTHNFKSLLRRGDSPPDKYHLDDKLHQPSHSWSGSQFERSCNIKAH